MMNKPNFPLSTRGSQIIDASSPAKVIRWVCVNYVASLETLLPEGLSHLTPDQLAATITGLGFNCVRLTWSVEMLQKGHMNAVGPGSAFAKYASETAQADIIRVNPWIAQATVLQCLERVIDALARQDLMIIADNHVSKAAWCSSVNDGSRWFGDSCFPVDEWLAGLREMACIAKRHPNIVAIGLRNELLKLPIHHGLSHTDWVHHMSLGARAVHAENSTLLLVAGGNFAAGNLGFIRSHHFVPEIRDRVVFESHIYNGGYVDPLWKRLGYKWTSRYLVNLIENRNGFVRSLKTRPAPYFLGEFGLNCQVYPNAANDTMFFRAVTDWIRKEKINFGFWCICGSYAYREGQQDRNEDFGLLTADYKQVRNPELVQVLQDIAKP